MICDNIKIVKALLKAGEEKEAESDRGAPFLLPDRLGGRPGGDRPGERHPGRGGEVRQ